MWTRLSEREQGCDISSDPWNEPRQTPSGRSSNLADGVGQGLEGRPLLRGDGEPQQPPPERVCGLPLFPPGPGEWISVRSTDGRILRVAQSPDAAAWCFLLGDSGLWHLAPAVREETTSQERSQTESELCRVAHGVSNPRLDRLRACGNGIVPLVAAYAWRTLRASLGI